MCKIGDIILIQNCKDNGNEIGKHSFVVISDENGEIQGLSYDMVCNVLSSFKNESQKRRKLEYPGNFPVMNEDTTTVPNNGKDGYLKTDQLYFFQKSKIDYTVIGNVNPEIFDLILEFIQEADFEFTAIIDNIKD